MSSNVGREALADIGNENRSFSKTEQGESSRPGKGKSEMMMCRQRKGKGVMMLHPERGAVDLGNTGGSPSAKLSRESVRLDLIQASEDNQTSKKLANKNIKATADEPRIKFQGRSSITATATGRKSLPELKQVSQVETSGMAKKSNYYRGKHGFPVKYSVRCIVPKPSNSSSRPWGNRVSDGFVVKSSRVQTKVDAGVLSRKSVKCTVQTTITATSTQRNSTSNHIFTTKQLRFRHADLSKRKQDQASVSKHILSVVSQDEPAPEEDISSGIIPRRKSDRRNSYASSLMSRSKLLKECSEVTSLETLPNIYDDRNHLEVCDYVDDIYQYYWVMEGQFPLKNYMGTQRDITPQMRRVLIDWLIEVHLKFALKEETLFLNVTLLDQYLSLEIIKKNEMQLVGLTALLLASKYEDFWHPRVCDLISISAKSYTRDEMLKMEMTILKKLKFRLNAPTPYVFMLRFLKAAQSDMKFKQLAFYLIELCLVEYEALSYKYSMLCASAIFVARCTLKITPSWTPLLAKYARYEESQIRGCAEMILKFHKAAKTTLLNVTYGKYAKIQYCRVATIEPLDRLPA